MKVSGTFTIKDVDISYNGQSFKIGEFTLNYETDLGELIEKLLSDPSIIQMLEQSTNQYMQDSLEEILKAVNN